MERSNWLPSPQFLHLNMACTPLAETFGPSIYLVGSALERRDFRDVDVRAILDDDDFDRRFPLAGTSPSHDVGWSLLCAALSLYLSDRSGLPVDFQFQRMTNANAKYAGRRHALGLFRAKPATPQPAAPVEKWGEPRRYRSDDRDLAGRDDDLVVSQGGNGDWYVTIVKHGEKTGPSVRLTTSGTRPEFSGVPAAMAKLYRALGARSTGDLGDSTE